MLADFQGDEGDVEAGLRAHALAKELWPFCRSLTGEGVRQTLDVLKRELPDLTIVSVPTGEQCFDWTVPEEWKIREAWIEDEAGTRIVDFDNNNLHVVGYSVGVDAWMTLEELEPYLYTLPEQPDAIPYVTSYYTRRWGFCLSHSQKEMLSKGRYRVFIDAELFAGEMNYGELLLSGKSKKEVLLSTYICHPSMANNELSGPVVTTALAQWISKIKDRELTYRILFLPETIGSICYISRHLAEMQANVEAGFVVTCVGDERAYSYMPSRNGGTLADQVALHVLHHIAPDFQQYSFLQRGSDERQYCSPGVDLPVASIMRSKYGAFPEYHTSLDDFQLVTARGLQGAYKALRLALVCLEHNCTPSALYTCEPQLGTSGLYPTLSGTGSGSEVRNMLNLLAYADGKLNLLEIGNLIEVPFWELLPIVEQLIEGGVLEKV